MNRKLHGIDAILVIALLLLSFSFYIPGYFRELMQHESVADIILFNFFGFTAFYSLLLIPIGLILYFYKKYRISLVLSSILILMQLGLENGIQSIFTGSLGITEYLIHLFGIGLVLCSFKFLKNDENVNFRILIYTLAITYILFLLFLTLIINSVDEQHPFILTVLLLLFVNDISKKISQQKFNGLYFVFTFICLYTLTIFGKCNIEFVLDSGIVNWKSDNLFNRCGTYYVWLGFALTIHYCTLYKLRAKKTSFSMSRSL
ncbi:hypothetical protein GXP67_33120 [Rhodocytophaga rosea]|uniref:Uncharacterized protein n=1 Tax=Rhodocytophaga rosea TaxID=2704465 RepID=A0A6C0GUZ0_9BACT|nr:hypothetical protein [Rhodocytophaga rosea]QHT71152.1 hypothetical protein GXP67_33120 [Rhodocytophaga rosea]